MVPDAQRTQETKQPMNVGYICENKWFYREKTRRMPRMRNLPPYDSNEIVKWFAELYQCDIGSGRRHFERARSLSARSFRANPEKWPAFLVFDQDSKEWHGSEV